ncbi:MAG: PASTA domain-containing protein [Candidatus Hydrogenedentes bacterium]|nr:PASTA domain-containing protein [Candidatus Hydrogenedentota bacterium]
MKWGRCEKFKLNLMLSITIVLSIGLPIKAFSAVIQISTLEELNKIGRAPGYPMYGDYVLVNDIDATETSSWPGGFEPIGNSINRFVGTFDGSGYVIKNLYIDRTDTDYVGLFGFVQSGVGLGGIIKNLRLENCIVKGREIVGGLVGDLYYGAQVEECVFTGEVHGSRYVGGLVGVCAFNSIIRKSYTVGSVICENYEPSVSYVGGLVGAGTNNVLIENSYSRMDIESSIMASYVGGFIGLLENNSQVDASYSTGKVSIVGPFIGGFIGVNYSSNVRECFWDIETSGRSISDGGTGLTTTQMKDFNTYSNLSLWNLSSSPCFQSCSSNWGIYDGITYPFLCSLSGSIPDVSLWPKTLAQGRLSMEGFRCREKYVYSNLVQQDYVVTTVPEDSCLLGYYEEVEMRISLGPYPPKMITSIEELQKIGSDPNYPPDGEYWIMNDIDATNTWNWNEGRGFIPIPVFRGKLYGLGHKIVGLYINNDYDPSLPTGLFARLEYGGEWEGLVANLIVENAYVRGFQKVGILAGEINKIGDMATAPTIENTVVHGVAVGAKYVGGVAGVLGGGSIFDTSVRVRVRGIDPPLGSYNYWFFGGVVGYVGLGGGVFTRVSYMGEVSVPIGSYLGGLTGYAYENFYVRDSHTNCEIRNCDANTMFVGGIAGEVRAPAEIVNSYSVPRFCNILGNYVGGLVGYNSTLCFDVSISGSFWDKDESGVTISRCGGTPLGTVEMKQENTFQSVGWDFNSTWGIVEGSSYPLLRNEYLQMPGVVGYYIDTAVSLLLSSGLTPAVEDECSNIYPENFVVNQSVSAGEWLKPFSFNPTIWRSTGFCPPIYVSTIEAIQSIGKSQSMPKDGYYILTTDIDASVTREWNSGQGFEPILDFRGIFNGNGHLIKNLYINRPFASHVGLFNIIGGTGRVCNTYLLNAEIVGGTYVGIIAGGNYGYIWLCGVHGSVGTAVENSDGVGGLVGVNMNEVERSMAVANVTGKFNVGGIVGLNNYSVKNCYALCNVRGISRVGGFIGYDNTSVVNMVINSFASGSVNLLNPGEYGGFCGYSNTGDCGGCFWDVDVSQVFVSGCGEGKTTIEMKGRTLYLNAGWDVGGIWDIYDDQTYPFLLNQPRIYVSNYEGFPFLEAYETLTEDGLIVEYMEVYDDQYPAGFVISHTYADMYLPLFYTVEFIVSKGPYPEGEGEGVSEGGVEGHFEGEGVIEGEGLLEGIIEGEGALEGEGVLEGGIEGEGTAEGEGLPEGSIEGEGTVEGEISPHSADQNGDWKINLSELLRVIQFFNSGGYHCAGSEPTEDGYLPGYEGDKNCKPHASDYNSQDWIINLNELLRLIQFFNMGGYYQCPTGEDGYCPGSP